MGRQRRRTPSDAIDGVTRLLERTVGRSYHRKVDFVESAKGIACWMAGSRDARGSQTDDGAGWTRVPRSGVDVASEEGLGLCRAMGSMGDGRGQSYDACEEPAIRCWQETVMGLGVFGEKCGTGREKASGALQDRWEPRRKSHAETRGKSKRSRIMRMLNGGKGKSSTARNNSTTRVKLGLRISYSGSAAKQSSAGGKLWVEAGSKRSKLITPAPP